MKYIRIFLILILLASQSALSQVPQLKGICLIDRTVESYEFDKWSSAKSRSMPDYIPIRLSGNLLYLGPEEAEQFVFINREVDSEKNKIISVYESNKLRSRIILYYLTEKEKEKPLIIFSKGVAPYFFGQCELQNKTKQ